MRRTFALCFLGVFLVVGAWSLATPLFASPDEPDQVIKAVAVVHGQFVGSPAKNPTSARVFVHVPVRYMSGLHVPGCFVGRRNVTPNCAPPLVDDDDPINVSIYVGRYPPLYYAVVGLPSLFSDSDASVYAMRLLSAALTSVFLALALSAVLTFATARVPLAGVLLAATPEVLFFGGVVNPSSLELSTAICFWTAVLLLARGDDPPPTALIVIATSAGVVEVLCRSLSPLWVAITLLAGLACAGRRRLELLARTRGIRIGAICIVAAAILAVAWILGVHALHVQTVRGPAIAGSRLHALLDRQEMYLHQTIGEFGTEDIAAPALSYWLWTVGVAGLALLALARGRWPRRGAFLLLVVVAFVVPFAVVLSQSSALNGFVWQGRDGAPLTLGLPIAAGVLAAERLRWRRAGAALAAAVALAVGVVQLGAFINTLDRYTAGAAHDFDFFAHTSWQPPIGARWLFLLFSCTVAVGSVASAAYLARSAPVSRTAAPDSPTQPAPVDANEDAPATS